MAGNGKWRTCACGCGRRFRPRVRTQKYFEYACKNKAGQARLRERAKGFPERQAEAHGAMGGND